VDSLLGPGKQGEIANQPTRVLSFELAAQRCAALAGAIGAGF
jgi:hypothetical protein